MLLPLHELKKRYSMNIKGVVQVGCHWAEEHQEYLIAGIEKFVYIEPCKKAIEVLKKEVGYMDNVKIFPVACGDVEGKMEMFVTNTNQGQSNSLLKPKEHLNQHPEVIFSETEMVDVVLLDNLQFNRADYNFLVMDVQGFEGRVLKGGLKTLESIDYVMSEVNRTSVYEGNTLIAELDELLSDFERVELHPWIGGWSDAFYIRKTLLKK